MTVQTKKMCVLCFNSQWRSVVIGTVSSVIALLLLLFSIGYKDSINAHLETKVAAKRCYSFVLPTTSQSTVVPMSVNWTKTLMTRENDCVFLAFTTLFPWPLWIVLASYSLLNMSLVASAVYKWTPGVTVYLAADALYLGLLATILCLSFFPSGLTRIALLTVLFPMFSLALCAWMTVFGFYLRLEDREKRARKRALARQAMANGVQQYWDGDQEIRATANGLIEACRQQNHEFVNLAFVEDKRSDA